MCHLQRVFSRPLGYQYPTFSPCCHLPWSISILFHRKMHSGWFNRIEILLGRWQHGEKVGYCHPSELEKTLCKWDIYVPLVTKGLIYLIYPPTCIPSLKTSLPCIFSSQYCDMSVIFPMQVTCHISSLSFEITGIKFQIVLNTWIQHLLIRF